jgi:hypothetical protein
MSINVPFLFRASLNMIAQFLSDVGSRILITEIKGPRIRGIVGSIGLRVSRFQRVSHTAIHQSYATFRSSDPFDLSALQTGGSGIVSVPRSLRRILRSQPLR